MTDFISYGCSVKNLIVTSRDTHIMEVSGNHKYDRTNNDVTTFYAYNPPLKYIPKQLGFIFSNLKTIFITKSSLSLIEFRDFQNMKKLQKLYLPENQIEKVPFCVFKYVKNLEVIDLSGNQIKALHEDTFTNLPNLLQFICGDNDIEHLENGLFRNNFNLKRVHMQENQLKTIEINFMKIKGIEVVDLRFNPCINLSFGCCKGIPLRDFQNQTSGNCNGPEVC
ncbi:CLUMA_CG009108, isoform A [Clunio marinus]|uniref:CLUMA_CG009108, isoform A n=1 Tax=Clunio marinus TaxID=568069 RepID=A0A1J1I7C9_9DIPT|nr:CLUMA_CG009108, isoform A [Clunio marinus]